jgi:hypothetical protein
LIRDTVNDYLDIRFFDSDTGVLVGGNFRTMAGYVARSTDGGQTWNGQIPPGQLLRGLWFSDPRHGWAVGGAGTILHTSDGGVSWQPQSSGVDTTLYDVKFQDTLVGVACGVDVVLLTTDGGQTWTTSTVGLDEPKPSTAFRQPATATIVHGVLWLPGARRPGTGDRCALLDVSGCKVLDLKPGANDVSRIAPGAYFVRGSETEGGRPGAVRKVVLTR